MEAKQETKADGVEARANALKEEGNAALAGQFLRLSRMRVSEAGLLT